MHSTPFSHIQVSVELLFTILFYSKLVTTRFSSLSWDSQRYHMVSITVWKNLNVRVETKSGEGLPSIWCVRRKGQKGGWEKTRSSAKSLSFWHWDVVGDAHLGILRLRVPHKHPYTYRHIIWNSSLPPPCSAHCQPLAQNIATNS